VLNALAVEQSHKTIAATSSAFPKRFRGLAAIISSTTLSPNLLMRSVSIGPGATQFMRMAVPQTSRDKALVSAITPALAAEYAAGFGKPSLPARDPILNAATSRTPHDWENLASHLEHANEVNLDDLLAFASAEFIKGQITAEISRIVDKDVDARRLTEQ
jgi:hypothetical protein